jgi:hypothetical protein
MNKIALAALALLCTAVLPASTQAQTSSVSEQEGYVEIAKDAYVYAYPLLLNRLALGDRDKLVTNADGSLDLYIQANTPGSDKEANWLPVDKKPFTLLMRLYSPNPEFLAGAWTPPPVRKVN